jgi:hypothetical protein
MAILTAQAVPVNGGLVPVPDPAAAGGDEAPVGAGRLLYVLLGSAATAAQTVTVATPGTVKGMAIEDVTASLDPGDVWLLPLTREFRDPTTGRASVTYSDATNMSVAVLEPGR